MQSVRPIGTLVLAAVLLVPSCGGSLRAARTVADDVIAVVPKSSLDEVAVGGLSKSIDEVIESSPNLQQSIGSSAFQAAVASSADEAAGQVQTLVQRTFQRADEFVQKRIEAKVKKIICEAWFYAFDPTGDTELLRFWVQQELLAEGVSATEQELNDVTNWLLEKMSDATSTHSLACFAWMQVTN